MFLFGEKTKSFLGIDIGASSIKLVELEKKEGRYGLKNYAVFHLGDYLRQTQNQSFLESFKLPNEEVAQIIKELAAKAKIKTKDAYLSIPVYSSFSTVMDLPIMPEKELAAAISFEARKYVPVPISEVILDWSIISLPSPATDGRPRLQVLLVAVPREVVNDYSQIIKLAGLKLRAIEEETFSLVRTLVGNDKMPVVLVDAGARSINVSIVDDGYIRLTHNLEMGLERVVKMVAKRMELTPDKISHLRESLVVGQSVPGGLAAEESAQLKEVVTSLLDSIIITVKKIINSYQEKYNRKIEKCVLTGGEIHLVGLVDYFINRLGVEVSVGNPLARVVYPSLLQSFLKDLGPSLAVAIGLAMRQ